MSEKSIAIAEKVLLNEGGIDWKSLEKVFGKMLQHRLDDADIYLQSVYQESWLLEGGIVKEGSYNIDRGVGVRAISGEKTGFAYSDDIVLPALEQAGAAAGSIAAIGGSDKLQIWNKIPGHDLYVVDNPIVQVKDQDKIKLLQQIELLAKQKDSRVQQVVASLSGMYEVVLVMDIHGHMAADVRPLVRLNVQVIVEQNGRREQGSSGGGGRKDYQYFLQDQTLLEQYVEQAVQQALVNLEAQAAPAGTMPVVLGPGWPGVLLHEAVGHGLEGDFNRKGTSAFSNKIGQQVATAACTVVDDGCIAERRGSLNVDDEGTPTQQTVLIENGILKNYMQDKMNARLLGMQPTGNARRQSYAHIPMPRMTNTYMLAGKYDPQEIISSVKDGLYAVQFDGGQVDITSGKFVFSTSEAYLIKDGKIVEPVKGATLIGNGPDVLTKVSMVGNDLQLDQGIGVCGKEGQQVPVGVGQPTLKIDSLTVGGTNKTDE